MKVVLAYCQIAPATAAALERDGITPVYEDTSGDDQAYWRAIRTHWLVGHSFVVLEQDKIPAPGALQALHDCPEPWCTYPVPMAHNGEPCDFCSLSCTKFGAELMQRWPDLLDRVGETEMGMGLKHWNRLDMAMALWVQRRLGRPVHWHPAGMVGHQHIALEGAAT